MNRLRIVLGAVGVAAAAYGVWSMRDFDLQQLGSLVLWLAAGVALHDGVLAGVTVLLGVAASRLLPVGSRKAVAVAFILWATLTVVALPVLSGMGGKPDNPTLLDRDYRLAWLLGTAALLVGVLLVTTVRGRTRERRHSRS